MDSTESKEHTTYHELKVGQTLYRVTSIYEGNVKLDKVLEDVAVKRVIQAATPSLLE